MAEPKKVSSWLAAAKAAPSTPPAPSPPDQASMLAALCNTGITKDADDFVTVVRASQRRKSWSPQKGSEPPLPQGDEFPALASPLKRDQPSEGPVKTRKEARRKDGHKDRAEGDREEKEGGKTGELTGSVEKTAGTQAPGGKHLSEGQETLQPPTTRPGKTTDARSKQGGLTKAISEAAKSRTPPPREVTAEFDGLITELLNGLRLQTPEQGLAPPPTARPQTEGPVQATYAAPQNKVVLSPQVQRALAASPKDRPVNFPGRTPPLPRVLFPNPQPVTQHDFQTPLTAPRPPSPRLTKPPTALREPIFTVARGPIPASPVQTLNPPARELSFFAVPLKTPNPYSPKSVLDLSSPEGSPKPTQDFPTNQTPSAKRSAYRPAMHADPNTVIGRKAEAKSPLPEVMTSSPFSYTLWVPPMTSEGLSWQEADVLRESPCNVVTKVNPAKGSRLGAWLGMGPGGLLETESEFHQALIRGVFTQPTPFQQPIGGNTGAEDDELFCKICFERESNSTYLCGHVLCNDCAEYIHVHKKICPFCSKPIESVVRMFA